MGTKNLVVEDIASNANIDHQIVDWENEKEASNDVLYDVVATKDYAIDDIDMAEITFDQNQISMKDNIAEETT